MRIFGDKKLKVKKKNKELNERFLCLNEIHWRRCNAGPAQELISSSVTDTPAKGRLASLPNANTSPGCMLSTALSLLSLLQKRTDCFSQVSQIVSGSESLGRKA